MQYLLILVQALPFILQLVGIAERYFTAPGSGAIKKQTVMEASKVLIEGITAASTGGQKETWERIGPSIGAIIDNAVEIAFPHADDQHIG